MIVFILKNKKSTCFYFYNYCIFLKSLIIPFRLLWISILLLSFITVDGQGTFILKASKTDTFCKNSMLYAVRLFRPGADLSGGIIASVPQGGNITIRLYSFDPLKPNNRGTLLYQLSSTKTSDHYSGEPMVIPHNALGPLGNYIIGNWSTNDLKLSLFAFDQWTANVNHYFPYPIGEIPRPVIMELTMTSGVILDSVKFPGIQPVDLSFFKAPDPFIKVLEAFKNPLDYPDYYIVAAHRGYWKDYPENSLPAYDLTVASGADMVELDTRLTKDDTLVAFHDECLDRITTGSGKLREKTWNEIKNLQLKDRFGNPTGFHLVTIRQALQYLKGRALVNLDFKEQIKNRDGSPGKLTQTFLAALQLAKETETLSQLVIKGKYEVDDLQDILTDAGISINDFTYTPVAFGWDTKDRNTFVRSWLQQGIKGIELTYKVAYDPILSYVPIAINKNIRAGIYTFWPEDCNGVVAEDRINDSANFCKFNYRQYAFLEENDIGTIPSYAGESEGSGPLDPIQPDDYNYGGGDYSYSNYKPKKLGRPEMSNDGRGDWDWLLSKGANFLITDRPVQMVQYLESLGKRTLKVPVLREVKIPDCPTVEDGTGGKMALVNLRGMVRKVDDYHQLEFFAPDSRNINIDTNRVLKEFKEYSNGKTREWVRNYMENHEGKCTCADLFVDSPAVASIRKYPLYSLPEWSKIYPGYDVYINANWFDVRQPWPINDPKARGPLPKAMYKEPCTNVFGYWQASPVGLQKTGTLLTTNSPPGLSYDDCDGLMMTIDGTLRMINAKDLPDFFGPDKSAMKSLFTLGGYIIARNGVPIPYKDLPKGTNKTVQKKRSLIGMNGNEIFFAEFQSPMLEPYQVADLMVNSFGCKDVFMFDAGGSVTMLSSRGQFPELKANAGAYITSSSAPEDRNIENVRVYRPIPNFLAVRVKQ